MIRAAVVGATGYAGAELVRLLAGHPNVSLDLLTSRQFAGHTFSTIYPALAGRVDQVCQALDVDRLAASADVVFLALPHKVPMQIVPQLVEARVKVIDLSADFRFQDQATYEAHYQPHSAGHLLSQAVYGLSELNAEAIADTVLVGNPGCYPTSALLPLAPLLKSGLVEDDAIIIDAKSGVSGAGRGLSATVHFCHVHESFKAYKVAAHRHTPEIEAGLAAHAGRQVQVTFTPHLVPMTRGMLTTTYAGIAVGASEEQLRRCLGDNYREKPFVRICGPQRMPDTLFVKGTNYCDIGLKVDARTGRVIIISAIDNLVKGAAGQAVQNMNLMFGCAEIAGLDTMPWPL